MLFWVDIWDNSYLSLPRTCWTTSLAHRITRKGRLLWIQRKRQRRSDRELLGSPESGSESGASSSCSEVERGAPWSCLCECEWLWEWARDLLDDAPPPDSPPVMETCTSPPDLSGVAVAAAEAPGVLVSSSGCKVRDKPFPVWTPPSTEEGCITVQDSLSFTFPLEFLWGHKHSTRKHKK